MIIGKFYYCIIMKKIILFFIALVSCLTSSAQFVATKDGMASTDSCGYYIEKYANIKASILYAKAKEYFSDMEGLKGYDTDVKNEEFSVHLLCDKAFISKRISNMIGSYAMYMDIDVVYKISFKDGKIRFDAPVIKSMGEKLSGMRNCATWNVYLYNENYDKKLSYNIFDKNGKVVRKEKLTCENLNKWINENIKGVSDYIRKTKADTSNW